MAAVLAVALSLSVVSGRAGAQVLDPDFWVVDNDVNAAVLSGNTLYLGGNFSTVGPRTGSLGWVHGVTGAWIPGFPRVDGRVNAIAPDGAGGWFIAGSLVSVGGVPRSQFAHVLADLEVDSWNPDCDGAVLTLAYEAGTLYVGGDFNHIDGAERTRLAAFDVPTNTLRSWSPSVSGLQVRTILPNGGTVFAGGRFSAVGGVNRNSVVQLDALSGQPTAWDPALAPSSWVYDIVTHGDLVYLCGSFGTVGGQPRSNLASVNCVTGAATNWNPNALQGDVTQFAVQGDSLFVGGSFHVIGGQPRSGLASFDLATGAVTSWNPPVICGACYDLLADGGTIYLAGNYQVDVNSRGYSLAAMDAVTGGLLGWAPKTNGPAYALGVSGGRVLLGGEFSSAEASPRAGLAALDLATNELKDWNPGTDGSVRALALDGATLYVGGWYSMLCGQDRWCLGAVDIATGALRDFRADADLRPVNAVATANGVVYAGGEFSSMNGEPRSGIAAVNAATGALLPWGPSTYEPTRFLEFVEGTLYAGGSFAAGGEAYRQGVAAFDPVTGLVTDWNPDLWGTAYDIEKVGGTIYIGGSYGRVQGVDHFYLSAVDAVTGAPAPWDPGATANVNVLRRSGNTLYVGGEFGVMGGQVREGLAGIDLATGLLTDWAPLGMQTTRVIVVAAGAIYAGGSYRDGPSLRVGLKRFELNPSDVAAPSAHVLSPNGGEVAFLGEHLDIGWYATDDIGVQSVDVYLSRNGSAGPWERLAQGVPNTGSFRWTVTGAESNFDAWVRVDAWDAVGKLGSDTSDAGFSISSLPVPTLVELFRLEDRTDGVAIHWSVTDRSAIASLSPQRGAGETGEWTEVAGTPEVEGASYTLVDREATPAAQRWYRLAGVGSDGRAISVPPLSIVHEAVTAFALDRLAPNPVSTTAQVSYALPRASHVRMSLVDVQGREVSVLVDVEHAAGRHVARLDVSDLRAGLYFLRMRVQDKELRQRLIVVR